MLVPLFYLAHSRTGDKGDSQTASLIPYDRADYALIARAVTPAAVKRHFGPLVEGEVHRYDLPLIGAFNFVLEGALQGGVNDSLALDTHGKSRSAVLLALRIDLPDDHAASRRCRADRQQDRGE